MVLNYFLYVTVALYTVLSPLAVWDHFVPHVDAGAEYEEYVEREAEKAAARLFEEYKDQKDKEYMKAEMDEWRKENGYFIWDEENKRYLGVPEGCCVQAEYQGTCGPPDRDR